MSEQSNENPTPVAQPTPSEPLAPRDFVGVECSGLVRAFDLLASGQLDRESALALLRHELTAVQRQAEGTCALLQKSSVELRQLRESAQREQVQKQDEQRQLQDQNDRFVANLIHEHDVEKATLRRERDAAIDRVRELARGIARAGSSSSASIPHLSLDPAIRSAPPPQNVVELKARIDELLYERDRSLRLLRQLAEQRDLAESRLQATLASIGSSGTNGSDPERAGSPANIGRTTSNPNGPPVPVQTQVARGSREAATPVPGSIPTPILTARNLPQSHSIELATLEDPDNWEVGPPALAGNEAPNESTKQGAGDVTTTSHASAADSASTSRFTKEAQERSGAYSMVAAELADDEMHLARPRRTIPKTT